MKAEAETTPSADATATPRGRPHLFNRVLIGLSCVFVLQLLVLWLRVPPTLAIDIQITDDDDSCQCAIWSPDGKQIAVSRVDVGVTLHDAATGKKLMALDTDEAPYRLLWTPKGELILGWRSDVDLLCWEVSSGKVLWQEHEEDEDVRPTHIDCSPDGAQIVAVWYWRGAFIQDIRTGKVVNTLSGQKGRPTYARFSPDGSRILTCHRDDGGTTKRDTGERTGPRRYALCIWDRDGGCTQRIELDEDISVHRAGWSPDGTRVFARTGFATDRLWHAGTGELVGTIEGAGHYMAYSPDGFQIAVAHGWHSYIMLLDAKTLELQAKLIGHLGIGVTPFYSPDGRFLLTCGDETSRVWEMPGGKCVGVIPEGVDMFNVAFSPSGDRILTDLPEGPVIVWRP